ncbi:hypothetical protein VR7878_02300 [Vibrio ruber DSM 16370]|uniref:Uncharacterized protein n=1 Tax=Vibrio ruber (strain DSM 16370 / JCM 11486 / BCRC 17186 / CECT 7878 / LMG 23124 / VR1) TaxID=1123498 RepID=A0A1R4LLE2_VIBR1|nr:hypothetical protein VR7878_02300 [Vibrio ruber DSM 16370]
MAGAHSQLAWKNGRDGVRLETFYISDLVQAFYIINAIVKNADISIGIFSWESLLYDLCLWPDTQCMTQRIGHFRAI